MQGESILIRGLFDKIIIYLREHSRVLFIVISFCGLKYEDNMANYVNSCSGFQWGFETKIHDCVNKNNNNTNNNNRYL